MNPNPALNADPFTRQEPYTVIPYDGQEFRRQGAITLPAEQVDSLVLKWTVPTGWDGVIWGVMFVFSGSGYLEASGDIIYRLNINRRWVKGLGSVNNTMGSLQQTFPLTEHERIWSGQVVGLYAYLGSGALGRLNPNGRIIAAIDGWVYPRCRQQKSL
jgi:hypothetical protein